MKTSFTKLPLLSAAGLLAAGTLGSANAAISQVDADFWTSTTVGTSYTIDGSTLDLTGASKLVVTLGAEGNASNGDIPPAVDTLTFGGVELTAAIISGGGSATNRRSSIWYLDLTGVSLTGTDFDLDFVTGGSSSRGYGFSAYTLAGTADGVSSTGESPYTDTVDHTLVELNTPTDNEYVIASYSRNASTGTVTAVQNVTLLYNVGLSSQYAVASAYGTTGAAGQHFVGMDGMNTSGRTVVATFAEAAIPEPGSLALLGLGGLCVLRRRRA